MLKRINGELNPYKRDKYGKWQKKQNWGRLSILAVTAVILGAYGFRIVNAEGRTGISGLSVSGETNQTSNNHPNCLKTDIGNSVYDCTEDLEALKKWRAYEKSQGKVTFRAVQTRYGRADSCHFPGKNGECLTAIGRDTKEGTTVACPRNIKLGTKIHIEGIGERVCHDRYAKWVDEKRGMPTVDVFVEDENLHTIPAYRTAMVTVLK